MTELANAAPCSFWSSLSHSARRSLKLSGMCDWHCRTGIVCEERPCVLCLVLFLHALFVRNFAQKASGDIVHKPSNCDSFWNPRVGAKFLQLLANIFVNILKAIEVGGRNRSRPCAALDSGAQILFGRVHESA